MGQALYRDYRPLKFSEVVGQDHITTTLQKAIKSGRISHAYLFTGPRGVGKTSVARILAHEVNQLPYDGEAIHLDIIEIDAASNRRIDEIRDLRDKVHISPTSAKYKVYIIDEVHMLTREAFNALLKTLEEPPAHCIFILATTEAHKLPETIISRTQRFEFKPIAARPAIQHLASIAKRENIKIAEPALDLLAEHGEGSFRDSIGLLDQLRSAGDTISEQDVRDFLGLPPQTSIQKLTDAITSGDPASALSILDELKTSGSNSTLLARILAKHIRQQLINNPADALAVKTLHQLIEVPASFNPDDALEIIILEASGAHQPARPEPVAPPEVAEPEPVEQTEELEPLEPVQEAEPVKQAKKPELKAEQVPKKAAVPKKSGPFDEAAWEEILESVKQHAASLYTALRLASPSVSDGKLILAFQFPLHQKKVDVAKHKDLIGQTVAEVTGQKLQVEAVVDKSAPKPTGKKSAPKSDEELKTISNIFGTPEVLES